MSELFETYEQDFVRNLNFTKDKLDSVSTSPTNSAFTEVKSELSEAEKSLKYLQTEYGSFSPQKRSSYQRKITDYRKSYNDLRKRIASEQDQYNTLKDKQALLGGGLQDSDNAQEKFLKRGQQLADTTYKLKNSLKLMQDNEVINDGIQVQLVSQTERLKKNRDKINVINEDLSESQLLVRKIGSLMRRNKLVLGTVIFVIVLILIIVLVVNLKGKSS